MIGCLSMNRSLLAMLLSAAGIAVAVASVQVARAQDSQSHADRQHTAVSDSEEGGLIRVPPEMEAEHDALLEMMEAAAAAGGATGEAGREVKKHLMPHFEEENRVALPPLGLLEHLVKPGDAGKPTEEMRPAIAMGKQVEEHLSRFFEEHAAIARALDQLEKAATAEGKTEHLAFVEHLRAHAHEEEVLLYPTTVIIGRYLELALGDGHGHGHGSVEGAGASGASSERIVLDDAAVKLDAQPTPHGRHHKSLPLSEHGPVSVVLMQFEGDAYVPDHTVPGVVMAHVVEGRLRITAEGKVHDLGAGEVLVMAPGTEHDVRALEPSRMLRTISLIEQ